MSAQTFWCIEEPFACRDPQSPGLTRWWDGEEWVTDIKAALRFADKESALLAGETVFRVKDEWFVTSHSWMGEQAPSPRTVTEERWGLWHRELGLWPNTFETEAAAHAFRPVSSANVVVRVTLTYAVPEGR